MSTPIHLQHPHADFPPPVTPIVCAPDSSNWHHLIPKLDVVIDAVGGMDVRALDEAVISATSAAAARLRPAGAPKLAFVYTSGCVSVHRTRFWLWPWEKGPAQFVQYIDDDARVPKHHLSYTARRARRRRHPHALMRTGCIRPSIGIYGPGGDLVGVCPLDGCIVDWRMHWLGRRIQ